MDNTYYTVTVKFERNNIEGKRESSERISEIWASSGEAAINQYKPQFFDNEPGLIIGTEHFSVEVGKKLTGK